MSRGGNKKMQKFIPQKPEKEIISMRIDSTTLSTIDRIAAKTDISRNELINQCIVFALQNLDTESIKN